MNVRSLVFSFYFIFWLGAYPRLFYRRLAPDLPTLVTFQLIVQIQWNQRQNLRLEPLFPVNQLEHDFDNLKFVCKQIWIRTSFDRSLSFVAPIWLILFCKLKHFSWTFSLEFFIWFLSLHLCLSAYVCYCLFAIEFPECEACYYESLGFADRRQGK